MNTLNYEDKISECRKEIDAIDEKIISLLEKRIEVSRKTALIKQEYGMDIFDRKREQEIIRSISSVAKDKLSSAYIKKIYTVVMETSRQIQKDMTKE